MGPQVRESAFQTTQWTLVGDLHAPDAGTRDRAIRILVERYWPPVYVSARRAGLRHDDALDATQSFFADVVMSRHLFEQADGARGRMRTLVLTALKRHLVDLGRRQAARGAGRHTPLDGVEHEEQLASDAASDSPERAFDRRWALVLLEEAVARTQRHFAASGRSGHWLAFDARILRPAASATSAPPLTEVAAACGFAGPADAAAAVQVVKKRMLTLLREVIAETAADPGEQDEEFDLVMSLGG